MRRRRRRKKRFKIASDRYISKDVRDGARRRDDNRCVYCHRPEGRIYLDGLRPRRLKLEYGHVIPFSKGGDNCLDNIQMECKQCNRSKGARMRKTGWWTRINGRGAKGCRRHKKRKS